MVPTTGLEPVRCYSLEPESSASANSATWATESARNLTEGPSIAQGANSLCAAIMNSQAPNLEIFPSILEVSAMISVPGRQAPLEFGVGISDAFSSVACACTV